MINDILFLLLTLIAEVIGTIGGFGSSVFFVPMAAFFFDFQTVLGITAVFHVFSNLSKIMLFKAGLNKRLLIQLGIPAVIFVIIGGYLTTLFQSLLLELFLGIFLVGLSGFFLILPKVSINKGTTESIVGGSLSGFFAGFFGTGGAIRGLTMASFNLPKDVFIATSAAIDLGVDFSRSIVYVYNGFITKDMLIYIPFLMAIGYGGSILGKMILKKIPQDIFRKISLVLIIGVGLVTIIKYLAS